MRGRAFWKRLTVTVITAAMLVAVAPVTGADEAGGPDMTSERTEMLQRWDELQQRRAELRRELYQVERELRQLSRELWPHQGPWMPEGERRGRTYESDWFASEEWEQLREDWRRQGERLKQKVSEKLSSLGEDVLPWVPDAVVEGLAERTGRTPDEVRELIRAGAWDVLFGRPGDQKEEVQGGEREG